MPKTFLATIFLVPRPTTDMPDMWWGVCAELACSRRGCSLTETLDFILKSAQQRLHDAIRQGRDLERLQSPSSEEHERLEALVGDKTKPAMLLRVPLPWPSEEKVLPTDASIEVDAFKQLFHPKEALDILKQDFKRLSRQAAVPQSSITENFRQLYGGEVRPPRKVEWLPFCPYNGECINGITVRYPKGECLGRFDRHGQFLGATYTGWSKASAWEDLIKNPPERTPVEDNPWRRAHSPAEWVWVYDPRDILPERDDDEVL